MARFNKRRRRRHSFGADGQPRSGVGWVIAGGVVVAAGAIFLIARSANAATPPPPVFAPPPPPPPPGTSTLTPQQIAEMKANPETRFGPGHF